MKDKCETKLNKIYLRTNDENKKKSYREQEILIEKANHQHCFRIRHPNQPAAATVAAAAADVCLTVETAILA